MKRASVLGSPIKHSLSPMIQNAAYKKLGIDARYEANEVDSQSLDSFLRARLTQNDWCGFSLTMPLKERICDIAQSLEITLDEQSSRISSANTLYRENGSWKGASTDVSGFSFLLKDFPYSSATIIGAGGTARAAIEALDGECSINVVRRNPQRDKEIREAFPERMISFVEWSNRASAWRDTLVILAVPIEAISDLEDSFSPPEILIDALYSPWMPPLSQLQSDSGRKLFSGLELLCAQALGQIRLMTSVSFDEDELFGFLKSVAEDALHG
jgi:shikimate dehydrogenase